MSPFYAKLAFTNLKNNRSTYFPYLLTCIVSIITYYTMHSISLNQGLSQMPGTAILSTIFALGTIVIAIFSTVLLFYTNSFLIKRRKRELGLYSILGLEKRHVALVLFYETLFTSVIALVLGLLGGLLFSKLLFLILLNLLHFNVSLVFTVSVPALLCTLGLFSCIFLLTLLYNLIHIHLANPINLLRGGQQGEREPRASWLLTLIGVLALAGGYLIALLVKSPLSALLLFFVAVILVILGTFALFTSGSVAFLKLLRKNKRFYYQPGNFISVSGMIYRMKQNAAGLASICILSTMVLVTISATVSLYFGQKDLSQNLYTTDVVIPYSGEEQDAQRVQEQIDLLAPRHQVTVTDRWDYWKFSLYTERVGTHFLPETNTDLTRPVCYADLIPLEDYNRLSGQAVSLEPDEVLLFTNSEPLDSDTAQVGDITLRIRETLTEFPIPVSSGDGAMPTYYFVVKDREVALALGESLGYQGKPTPLITFNLEGADDDKLVFADDLDTGLASVHNLYVKSRVAMERNWFATYGGFLFLGLFLGALFMMATVLIIYYKQISEGYDDHARFEIMQKVGMSKREVRATIRKQILLVFFLPLAAAVIHMIFAFKVVCRLLTLFGMTSVSLFLLCTVLTIVVFAGLYALVYSLTAKTYYKLVEA